MYMYFVMEMCRGGDLKTFLQKQPKHCIKEVFAQKFLLHIGIICSYYFFFLNDNK